jgi:dinuclear metal center YbgI/SA1388 family protein
MKLVEIVNVLDRIAPPPTAESWDNVGLLVGNPGSDVTSAMLCIDYTPEVACEAAGQNCQLVIAYHPPIFKPLKNVLAGSTVFDAIRRGVAIYSPHTALDVADGGTNDVLADILKLVDRRPLKPSSPAAKEYKLVTFVPAIAVEKVSRALFDAGAGHIGKYSQCSFRSPGTGTFFGEEGTNPAVGQPGKLEQADEIRLETVVPISKIDAVIGALRLAHPYEEPAFDLNALAAPPTGMGLGRVGSLASPMSRQQVFATLKRELKIDHLLIAGPTEGDVTTAAVCAGACGDLLDDAIRAKVDLYVTGEMRHHDALKAASRNLTVVCTLHSNSERVTLARLRDRLLTELPGLAVHLSAKDRDPFAIH